jgi:oxygen-independent coproporphyrinogen-3 oxidase
MNHIKHLYIHIPFCPSKCPYCAFVTHVGSMQLVEPYVSAVQHEIESGSGRGANLSTVYFGGGTPSLLALDQVTAILDTVAHVHGLDSGAEITMEAHPATVDVPKLRGFRSAGITRISFGAESLDPVVLGRLGRGHGPARVLAAIEEARAAGFNSINADLIYGLPHQTGASWRATLDRMLVIAPDHVSLYPLQIEPRTVFGRKARESRLTVPAEGEVVEMYHQACAAMREARYIHYELANWALPGHECRHNLAYWRDEEYLAVGVGAHAYVHPFRTENMRGTRRYIDTVLGGRSPIASRESIDTSTALSERVILGLRLLERGLDLNDIEHDFGLEARQIIETLAGQLFERGLLHRIGSRVFLPEHHIPIANDILDRFVLLEISMV